MAVRFLCVRDGRLKDEAYLLYNMLGVNTSKNERPQDKLKRES